MLRRLAALPQSRRSAACVALSPRITPRCPSVTSFCPPHGVSLREVTTAAASRPQFASVLWLRKQAPVGASTSLHGWVRSVRKQKGVTFIELNDGSCQKSAQVVVGDGSDGNHCELVGVSAGGLSTGCSIEATGTVVASPHAAQRVELLATSVRMIGQCDAGSYPLQKKVRHVVHVVRCASWLRTVAALSRLRCVCGASSRLTPLSSSGKSCTCDLAPTPSGPCCA